MIWLLIKLEFRILQSHEEIGEFLFKGLWDGSMEF